MTFLSVTWDSFLCFFLSLWLSFSLHFLFTSLFFSRSLPSSHLSLAFSPNISLLFFPLSAHLSALSPSFFISLSLSLSLSLSFKFSLFLSFSPLSLSLSQCLSSLFPSLLIPFCSLSLIFYFSLSLSLSLSLSTSLFFSHFLLFPNVSPLSFPLSSHLSALYLPQFLFLSLFLFPLHFLSTSLFHLLLSLSMSLFSFSLSPHTFQPSPSPNVSLLFFSSLLTPFCPLSPSIFYFSLSLSLSLSLSPLLFLLLFFLSLSTLSQCFSSLFPLSRHTFLPSLSLNFFYFSLSLSLSPLLVFWIGSSVRYRYQWMKHSWSLDIQTLEKYLLIGCKRKVVQNTLKLTLCYFWPHGEGINK